jgi:hypothetical protein
VFSLGNGRHRSSGSYLERFFVVLQAIAVFRRQLQDREAVEVAVRFIAPMLEVVVDTNDRYGALAAYGRRVSCNETTCSCPPHTGVSLRPVTPVRRSSSCR